MDTMDEMATVEFLKKTYDLIKPFLDEEQRRAFLGAASLTVEGDGVNRLVEAGMGDPQTIARGREEVMAGPPRKPARTKAGNVRGRNRGGGRKRREEPDKSELESSTGDFGVNGSDPKASRGKTSKPEN